MDYQSHGRGRTTGAVHGGYWQPFGRKFIKEVMWLLDVAANTRKRASMHPLAHPTDCRKSRLTCWARDAGNMLTHGDKLSD